MSRSDHTNQRRVFTWILAALALVTTAIGQDPVSPPADPLSVEAIEAKITKIEANKELEEGTKTAILDAYRDAVAKVKLAKTYVTTSESYRQLVETGPPSLVAIRGELKAPAQALTPPLDELNARSLVELENELTLEQARLAELQHTTNDLTTEINGLQTRPAKIREELAVAAQRLQQIDTELGSLEESNADLRDARLTRLRARKLARTNEIAALEQEQAVHQVRLDLLTARRDLSQRNLAQFEKRIPEVTDAIATKRREEAERLRVEAKEAEIAAEGKHPALVALAKHNADFVKDLEDLLGDSAAPSKTHAEIVKQLKRIDEEHKSARTKLERVGLSDMLGDIFLEQRKNMPDVPRYRKDTIKYRRQIAGDRLEQFNVDERRRALFDLQGAVDQVIDEAKQLDQARKDEGKLDEVFLTDANEASFRVEATTLLEQQADLLEKLDATYGRYLNVLGDLDFDLRQLEADVDSYRAFLDDHLLWTPSAPPLGAATFRDLSDALAWVASPTRWLDTGVSATEGLVGHWPLAALVLLLLVLSSLSRPWCKARLESIALRVRRRHADGFLLTVYAFLLTVALAAPLPLFLGSTGWLLAGTAAPQSFPLAVGLALAHVAGIMLLLQMFRLLLSEHGIARVHFAWHEHVLATFRRTIPWLLYLGLPALFVSELGNALVKEEHLNSLGRLAFIAGMIVLATFGATALAPGSGVLQRTMNAYPDSWLSRLRMVWFPLLVLTPVTVAVVAGAGYYYTALELDHRLLGTVLVIGGAVLVHNLVVRWLVIARTKLAIARAREKRAAAQAALAESPAETEAVDLDIPEIDLATIKEQSLRLFKTAIVITTVVSLFGIWADILPALGVFDRELWETRVTIGGEEQLRPVTIASILLALLVTLLSFGGAKNLPGFLEVTFLRRLEPGTRYAVATMGQYVLVAIGIFVALQTIGIAWSHVQWLVAALSVGLGFGLQEIFANFISGIILLVERPIRVGDTVTVGEVSGTVTRIRIRATTITDWDQKELVMPNKSFITGQLINWSLSNPVTRLTVNVGIAYGSDTELALRLMMAAAKEHPKVLVEPEPSVFFVGFGDSTLNFEVRIFVKELANRARTTIVHDMHMTIDQAFREHGVVIAFPQRDLHIKSGVMPTAPITHPAADS